MAWFSWFSGKAGTREQTVDDTTEGSNETSILDYATFDASSDKSMPPSGTVAILHFDFASVFPAISWVSSIGYDDEYPSGFYYKILTARHHPSNQYECAFVRELPGKGKYILSRRFFGLDEFPAVIENLIKKYEPEFSVKFMRVDFAQARTPEEFAQIQRESDSQTQPPPIPE